jgi:hypothetical protein
LTVTPTVRLNLAVGLRSDGCEQRLATEQRHAAATGGTRQRLAGKNSILSYRAWFEMRFGPRDGWEHDEHLHGVHAAAKATMAAHD